MVVLFTLYYPQSWLDSYFGVYQLATLFVFLALFTLQRLRPGWLSVALLSGCAIGSSLSTAFGLAAWVSLPVAAASIDGYRRPRYLIIWTVLFISFLRLYTSDYAVTPYPGGSPTATTLGGNHLLRAVWSALYLLRFPATRFDTDHPLTTALSLACGISVALTAWRLFAAPGNRAPVTLFLSLALFSIVGAALIALGRAPRFPIPLRYSPGADGFWVAFSALALMSLRQRSRDVLTYMNVALLIALVALTVHRDIWGLRLATVPFPSQCDRCVLDYPLTRNDCVRQCFAWSDDQSVYHLAALRLSTFKKVTPRSILPPTDAPVIIDLPNRWLSVYVRDFMLPDSRGRELYTIAPSQGQWSLPRKPYSPFYRGEWPTEILPEPLTRVWESLEDFVPDLAALVVERTLVWYVSTPETASHSPAIGEAFTKIGYRGRRATVTEPQYQSARFSVWCFEKVGSEACASRGHLDAAG